MNFTEDHLDIIDSLFYGANYQLANLCDDPDDFSPHMPDARIRLLNTGTIGEDIFFYQDDRSWGFGTQGCDFTSVISLINRYDDARDTALANYPNPDEEAFHIILTGGTWKDEDGDGNYDVGECHYPCGGGLTKNMGECPDSGDPLSMGLAGMYGTYLSAIGEIDDCGYEGEISGIGTGFLGELFHVLSLDHLSPLQAHINQSQVSHVDGCADTPHKADLNLLDCNFAERCALTECQIGRMHRLLAENASSIERFPDGSGGFSMEPVCTSTVEKIVIPDGADIVWNGPKLLRSGIVVEKGGSLTIKCELGMPSDAGIEVMPGGVLVVDGARIYNKCEDDYWQGITVNGDGQQLTNSGIVQIQPGSILERARQPVFSDRGGIVLASSSDIINSGEVRFEDFEKYNLSRFTGCHFERTEAFADFAGPNEPWPNQISLVNIRALAVSSCTFTTIPRPNSTNNGAAIRGFGANFTVTGTTIDGYKVGVGSYGWLGNATGRFRVRQCTLRNNQIGIQSWASNNINVRDNLIEGIGSYGASNDHIGMELEEGTGFTVQDNVFKGASGATADRYGILAINTGSESNEIERNSFEGLTVANQAEGWNLGAFESDGLQYECNTNIANNGHDFLVFDEGVARYQGAESRPSGNTFSRFNTADGDFRNESTSGITYFYYEAAPAEEPLNYFGAFIPEDLGQSNSCQPDEPDGPVIHIDPEVIREVYTMGKADFNGLRSTYDSLLNGGIDESVWVSQAASLTATTAPVFKQDLLDASPFVTREVLEAATLRDDFFTNQDLSAMLAANPDELRDPQLQSFLYAELPQAVADSLLLHQHQRTSRTDMEAEMAQHRRQMHAAANAMIKYELSDTSGLDLAAYRQWLLNKESLGAAYERAASYFLEDSLTLVEEKRDSIPLQFELSPSAAVEHAYYEDLTDILIEARTDSTHYAAYDSATVVLIQDIADHSEGVAGSSARGLLNAFYGYDYKIVPQDISLQQMRKPQAPENTMARRAQNRELTAVPNPVRDQVVFHYNLPQGLQAGVLKVFDVNGKQTVELQLDATQGQVRWRTAGQQRGLYYCIIEQAGYRSPPLKLLLID